MKFERLFLIAFVGNYIVNNIVAGIASLVPATPGATSIWTTQYIAFILLAAIATGLLTWWYLCPEKGVDTLKKGAIFGAGAFVLAIVTALVTGISGVLQQTGSVAQVGAILPNFWPFIWSQSTLALLVYWVVPAAIAGFLLQAKAKTPMSMGTMGSVPGSNPGPRVM